MIGKGQLSVALLTLTLVPLAGAAQSYAKRNPHVYIPLDNGLYMTREDPPNYYHDDAFSSILRLQNIQNDRLGVDKGEYGICTNFYTGSPHSEKLWQAIQRRDDQGNRPVHVAELVFHPTKILGDDNMWIVMANIGRGVFKLLPDTGSSDVWVLDARAKVQNSASRASENAYDKMKYKIAVDKFDWRRRHKNEAAVPFKPQHGVLDGLLVYGEPAKAHIDIIDVEGVEVKQTFGATLRPTLYFARMPLEGVLGLGFPPLPAENRPPFLHAALSQPSSGFESGIFAFYLAARNSQLRIGGVGKPDVFVDGSIEYHNLISPEHRSGHWEIGGGRVKMTYRDRHDDWKVKEIEIVSGFPTIIDSGINMILAPEEHVKKIYDKIPGSAFLKSNGHYVFPCWLPDHYFPRIRFSWPNGREWVLSRQSFTIYVDPGKSICLGAIQMESRTRPYYHNRWVLGSSFMMNVFTVFDIVKLRVGFGQLYHIAADQHGYPSPSPDLDSETLVQLTRWDPLAWHLSLLQLGPVNQPERPQSKTPQEHPGSSEPPRGLKRGRLAGPEDKRNKKKKKSR